MDRVDQELDRVEIRMVYIAREHNLDRARFAEANVGRAYQYRRLFPAMIRCWRRAFRREDMVFLWVQLAPFRYGRHDPRACAELWEAQSMALSLPHTGMAVALDLGNPKNIHPKNKQDVGRRLGPVHRRSA